VSSAIIQRGQLNAQRFLNGLYPNEVHGLEGDCINPKCDYQFTQADRNEIAWSDGWFTCPKCDWTYNYYQDFIPGQGGYTKSGLTMTQMGDIGETLIERMGNVPPLGAVTWVSSDYNFPIDAIIGDHGGEIKTNHSSAQPRFKISGKVEINGQTMPGRQGKYLYCEQNHLLPALVGVRLNFYTDKADVFVQPNGFKDTWIGSGSLVHAGTVDFTDLNPYKRPEDVPPANDLPQDDSTPAVEFPF